VRVRPVALAAILALCAGSGVVLATPANAAETDVATPVTDVAIVMPLTVPLTDPAVPYANSKLVPTSTSTPTLMDAETLAYYTSPTGILSTELDAVYDSDVTIGIDPLLIASIRALGSEAPESARAWLDRLASATNTTFALSWGDSDMTAPLEAGRQRVVKPTSLQFAIDPTRFSTSSTATPDPNSTPDPAGNEAPPLPTAAELTQWHYTLDSVAWPQADTVATKDFATIAKTYSTTLLSSTNVSRANTTSATATIGTHDALVADTSLSALVSTALSATDVDSWDSAMHSIKASIAAVSARTTEADPGSIVVTLDRNAQLPTARLTATVSAMAALSTTRLVGLDDVQQATGSTATLISERQSASHIAEVKKLLAEESRDARFATVADNPSLITGERRIRLLNALSPSVGRQAAGWTAVSNAYLADSTTLLQSVRLAPSSDIRLLGDSESIRVAVINDLDQPVTAEIQVRSLSPNLTIEQPRVTLKIEPNYQRTASVPVQAISNGEVQLAIGLSTKSRVPLGSTTFLPATVQAGWEGPFTLIAGILVVLVFAAGIARTVVRRRKARALVEADAS
jgi:Family of unknown function (DUF6049)